MVVAGWIAGCSSATEGLEDPANSADDVRGVVKVAIRLPHKVKLDAVTLGATNEVHVEHRSEVQGLIAVSNHRGDVNIGDRARVNGIVSRDDVRVGSHATVDGDIKAGGSAFVPRSARVTGTVRAHARFGPPNVVEWSADAGSNSAGPVTVAPGAVLDLPPGTYGDLELKSKSRLTLHTGRYFFKKVTLGWKSTVFVDSAEGPVQVYLSRNFFSLAEVKTATVGLPHHCRTRSWRRSVGGPWRFEHRSPVSSLLPMRPST
jgi:hypothetical protein